MATSKAKTAEPRVTWAEACRDIVTAAINKGQLPSLLVGAIVLVIVYRMPEADLSKLAHRIVDHLRDGALVGYALLLVVSAAFFVYALRSKLLLHKLVDKYPAKLAEKKGNAPPDGGTK